MGLIYVNSHQKKGGTAFSLWDFLPHEDEPPITLAQAMERWQ